MKLQKLKTERSSDTSTRQTYSELEFVVIAASRRNSVRGEPMQTPLTWWFKCRQNHASLPCGGGNKYLCRSIRKRLVFRVACLGGALGLC